MKLLAALLLLFTPLAAPPAEQVVISNGHVDLGPKFVAGKWTIQLRDDSGESEVWRPLENVVLQATGKARMQVPADPAYAFLGKPGQQVWVIPQVQQAGVIWPGWNTQDPEVAQRVDREVTWSLQGVRGPGSFTLFLNSDFGKPQPVFDSREPFPQQTGIDVNTHVHGNWTFDAEGTYFLDVAMTAKLTDGQQVTDRRTLRVHAGDGDARTAFRTEEKPAVAAQPETDNNNMLWVGGAAAALVFVIILAFIIRKRRARA